MGTLELDRDKIHVAVIEACRSNGKPASLSNSEVQFITDTIIEEMRCQYVELTRKSRPNG